MTATTSLVSACPVCGRPLDRGSFCAHCRYRSQEGAQRFFRSGWMLVSGGLLTVFLLFLWSRQIRPPLPDSASLPRKAAAVRPGAPLPAPLAPLVLPFGAQRCVPWELPEVAPPSAGEHRDDPGILVVTSRMSDPFGLTLSGVAEGCGPAVRSVVLEDLQPGGLEKAVAEPRTQLVVTVGSAALQRVGALSGSRPILFTQVTAALDPDTPGEGVRAGILSWVPVVRAVEHWLSAWPGAKPLALVYSAKAHPEAARVIKEEIERRGRSVALLALESPGGPEAILARASQVAGGWIVLPDPEVLSGALFERILVAAEAKRIPVAVPDEEHLRSGTLLGVGLDRGRIGQQACRLARVMLRGALPGESRVFCPQETFLAYNVTVAEKLGIMADPVLLSRAKIFKWH